MRWNKRSVIGRRIVDVRLNSFDGGNEFRRMTCHDVAIVLDDGAEIRFNVEETEVGVYGVEPYLARRGSKRARPNIQALK